MVYAGRGLTAPALFMPSEFPRIVFAGNSSHCIKTGVIEGHVHHRCLHILILGGFLPSQPKRSTLPSLEIAAVCVESRISCKSLHKQVGLLFENACSRKMCE